MNLRDALFAQNVCRLFGRKGIAIDALTMEKERAMTVYYYIDEFCDEMIPCALTPEAWAEWLGNADENWLNRAATPGETFAAHTLTMLGEVNACPTEDGWEIIGYVPDDADFFVVADSGKGWFADDILPDDGPLEKRIAEWADGFESEDITIQCGRFSKAKMIATWHGPNQPMTFAEVSVQ